jgi:hypothetical protein
MRVGDEDINTIYTSTPCGPLTRAHAHQHNHQVSSFLNSCPSYLYNGDACTLVLFRNDGEDQKDDEDTKSLEENSQRYVLPINMHPHISSIASIASVIDEER